MGTAHRGGAAHLGTQALRRVAYEALVDALSSLGDGVEVDFCRPATLDRMQRMLREADRAKRPYHLVHFDGHGTFLPNSRIGALCFEKDEDIAGAVKMDLVRADAIGDLPAAHRIPLVILEACRSGQLGTVAAFRGVAPRLMEAGVGSVLSMSHAVHMEATRLLLARFYEELSSGSTIGQALEEGRAALLATPNRWLARDPAESVPLKGCSSIARSCCMPWAAWARPAWPSPPGLPRSTGWFPS